jgi:hypothetical protein
MDKIMNKIQRFLKSEVQSLPVKASNKEQKPSLDREPTDTFTKLKKSNSRLKKDKKFQFEYLFKIFFNKDIRQVKRPGINRDNISSNISAQAEVSNASIPKKSAVIQNFSEAIEKTEFKFNPDDNSECSQLKEAQSIPSTPEKPRKKDPVVVTPPQEVSVKEASSDLIQVSIQKHSPIPKLKKREGVIQKDMQQEADISQERGVVHEVDQTLKIKKRIKTAMRLHAYLVHNVSFEQGYYRRILGRYEKEFESIEQQLHALSLNGTTKEDSSKQLGILSDRIFLIQSSLNKYYKSLKNKELKRIEPDNNLKQPRINKEDISRSIRLCSYLLHNSPKEKFKGNRNSYPEQEDLKNINKKLEGIRSKKTLSPYLIQEFNDLEKKLESIQSRVESGLKSEHYKQLEMAKKMLKPSIRLCAYLVNRTNRMGHLPTAALLKGQQEELEHMEKRLFQLGTDEVSDFDFNDELKRIELAVAQIQANLQENYKALPKSAPRDGL